MAKVCRILILSTLLGGAINLFINLKLTIMIEIADIIMETLAENENNAYYWDALNDRGYQLHINYDGTFICFKSTEKTLKVITAAEFEHAVNYECYLNSIGEDSFYNTFNNHLKKTLERYITAPINQF